MPPSTWPPVPLPRTRTTDKAIILITDGENHEDDAIGAAKAAAEKGIHVNIVGMGDPKGSPIPIQGSNNYMKDKDGNVVITKLNEQMGQESPPPETVCTYVRQYELRLESPSEGNRENE